MRLLSALVLLSLLMPAAATAAPLFCYWVESSLTATAGRALGQDGHVREIRSDNQPPLAQVIRSLEGADPSGDAIPSELMERLRALVVAASKGSYRDTPGVRTSWMDPHTMVACVVAETGQRPVTVILRECHNSKHINVAAAAPELMSYLTKLITPAASVPLGGVPLDTERILRSLTPCF